MQGMLATWEEHMRALIIFLLIKQVLGLVQWSVSCQTSPDQPMHVLDQVIHTLTKTQENKDGGEHKRLNHAGHMPIRRFRCLDAEVQTNM